MRTTSVTKDRAPGKALTGVELDALLDRAFGKPETPQEQKFEQAGQLVAARWNGWTEAGR